MAMSTFSVRMESNVKNELDKICAQLGLNTSVAINIFARTVIREKRISSVRCTQARMPV